MGMEFPEQDRVSLSEDNKSEAVSAASLLLVDMKNSGISAGALSSFKNRETVQVHKLNFL